MLIWAQRSSLTSSPHGRFTPDAVVLVATIRALKYNGGVAKDALSEENMDALKKGIVNLKKHIENLQKFDVPVVVTLNSFITDTEEETAFVRDFCEKRGCAFALSEVWEKRRSGRRCLGRDHFGCPDHKESHFAPIHPSEMSLKDKIATIAKEIYGAARCFLCTGCGKKNWLILRN